MIAAIACRSSTRRWFAATRSLLAALVCVAAWLVPGLAAAQGGQPGFDHLTTGFPLTGAHEDVRCETCHIKGIFKGTPRDCGVCHVQNNPRGAMSMPVTHLRSVQSCDACHSTSTFAGARFDHVMAQAGSCASCHNGVSATGKSPTHIVTSLSCDSCHTTVSFATSVVPGNHIPLLAGAKCDSCHTNAASTGSFAGAQMNHAGYSGNCAQCHAPSVASTFFGVQIKSSQTSPPHIPTSDNCETCHTAPASLIPTTGAVGAADSFAGGRMSHAGITSNCALCHGSSVVAGSFIGTTPKTNAGLTPPHLPTSEVCEACHANAIPAQLIAANSTGSAGATTFANGQMSHAGITSNCAACHGPGIAGTSFFGVTSIVVQPPTAPMGANSHIPVGTNCESCHLGSVPSVPVPANATKTAPGTAFATPAPTAAQIHSGVTSGCSSCHESSFVWLGMSAYPIAPTAKTTGAQYTGFNTRPRAAAGTFNVADATHPLTGDCSQCHSNTNAFTGQDKPANHIPTASGALCTACHTAAPDYAALPTLTNIHANAPSTTSNCAQCHSATAAASFAIPAANFSIVGLPTNHIPTSAACESCHVGSGSSVPALPVPNGAKFSGSRMNHAGITNNCAACHVPAGTASNFAGITAIVGMPPTSPMGAGSHIPSSTTCESCHLGSVPSGQVPANATKTAPGTAFATPAPTTVQIHSGVTGGCSNCHESSFVWMGVSAYPIAPTVLTSGAQYTGFQTRPRAAAGTFNVADATHPSTGDCSQCHSNTNAFTGQDKPANHIPTASGALCTACHTAAPDYATMPTLANIHANAPSTTGNCAQCHGAAAASFAIPAANFSIVGLPTNHIPTSAACESCHVGTGSSVPALPVPNGAKFSGSRMSHAGITNNCAACHVTSGTALNFAGITAIVGMPPTSPMGTGSHIPSSTTCESCHLGTLANVSGLVPANATKTAPGTLFLNPAPTTAQIHAGVTGGCNACHEASYVWMGVSAYPIAPTVLTSGAQYTGFQTRPRTAAGTFNVADVAHPTSGDCSQCHSGTNFFSAQDKPANHIPTAASAQCTACHTSPDFSVMPTLANIHANAPSTTTNCAQCHGAAAASFAIPAANFSIVGLPTNHIPTSAACESCHVGTGSSVPALPVPNGAKFSGSRMSHAGITNNCAACHVTSGTALNFAGITAIVGMPPTSPMGTGSHIPSSTTCESCHLGTLANVSGLVPANATKTAPGTLFLNPAPTTAQIHAGVTGGCNACHEAGYAWMGMSSYPIAPTTLVANAQYTGFQTRPRAAASSFNVADSGHPASGDCSDCHSGTNYFTGQAKPAGHIPTQLATCSTCHVVAGDFSIAGLTTSTATLHTGITSGCIACHTAGSGAGPFAGCATQAACSSPPPLTYQPKTMPLAAGTSPMAPSPNTHVPAVGIACEKCHSATVFTSFAGMNMMGNSTAHVAVGAYTCITCHEGGPPAYTWYGVTIVTRPVGHQGRTAGQDCVGSGCHSKSYTSFNNSALLRPIIRSPRITSNPRLLPGGMLAPDAAVGNVLAFDHQGVLPAQCLTCHNGVAAQGLPPKHLVTKASCDTCHRTTAWQPAQFSHQGVVAGQCASCHNTMQASGKPGTHFLTARSCDACHRTQAWLPVSYSHLSPAYRPAADKPTCVSCHVTNGEMIPRLMHGNPRVRPIPVPPGP